MPTRPGALLRPEDLNPRQRRAARVHVRKSTAKSLRGLSDSALKERARQIQEELLARITRAVIAGRISPLQGRRQVVAAVRAAS